MYLINVLVSAHHITRRVGLIPCRLPVLCRGNATRPPDEPVTGQHPPKGSTAFPPPDYFAQLCSTQDLESPSVTRVCLALDTIIQYPLEDIIPAIQTRLYDILSHNSSVYVVCSNKIYLIHAPHNQDPMFAEGPFLHSGPCQRNSGISSSQWP